MGRTGRALSQVPRTVRLQSIAPAQPMLPYRHTISTAPAARLHHRSAVDSAEPGRGVSALFRSLAPGAIRSIQAGAGCFAAAADAESDVTMIFVTLPVGSRETSNPVATSSANATDVA